MMIPFLTIVGFALSYPTSVKIDDKIRVCETSKSVIAIPYISVLRSYGFFEREIGKMDFNFEIDNKFYRIDDAKSIKRLPVSGNDKIILEFEFENGKIIREIYRI